MKRRTLLKIISSGFIVCHVPIFLKKTKADWCDMDENGCFIAIIEHVDNDDEEVEICIPREERTFFSGLEIQSKEWLYGEPYFSIQYHGKEGCSDFILQFSAGGSEFGRPVEMTFGHEDGEIFLLGSTPPDWNGGVPVQVTNSKLPRINFEGPLGTEETEDYDVNSELERLERELGEELETRQQDINEHEPANIYNHTLNGNSEYEDWWSRGTVNFGTAENLLDNVNAYFLEVIGGDEEQTGEDTEPYNVAEAFKRILEIAGEIYTVVSDIVDSPACPLIPGCPQVKALPVAFDGVNWVFEKITEGIVQGLEYAGITTDEGEMIKENMEQGMSPDEAAQKAFEDAARNELVQVIVPELILMFGTVIASAITKIARLFRMGIAYAHRFTKIKILAQADIYFLGQTEKFNRINALIFEAISYRRDVFVLSDELATNFYNFETKIGINIEVLKAMEGGPLPSNIARYIVQQGENTEEIYFLLKESIEATKQAREVAYSSMKAVSKEAYAQNLVNPYFIKGEKLNRPEYEINEVWLELDNYIIKKDVNGPYWLPEDPILAKLGKILPGSQLKELTAIRTAVQEEYFIAMLEKGSSAATFDKVHAKFLASEREVVALRDEWRLAQSQRNVNLMNEIAAKGKRKAEETAALLADEAKIMESIKYYDGQIKEFQIKLSNLNQHIVREGGVARHGGKNPSQGIQDSEDVADEWDKYRYGRDWKPPKNTRSAPRTRRRLRGNPSLYSLLSQIKVRSIYLSYLKQRFEPAV